MATATEPRFRQVATRLRNEILSFRLRPGDKLPGERELARRYGISHLTMNKALGGLVATGLLRREHGRGTFVAERPSLPGGLPTAGEPVLVVMDLSAARHPPFLQALPRFLCGRRYLPLMVDCGQEPACVERFATLARDGITCIVHNALGIPYATLAAAAPQCRCVFLGEYAWDQRVPGSYILSDFAAGGRQAAQHLLAHGRERCLLLTAPPHAGHLAPDSWEDGVRAALREAGAPAPTTLVARAATPEDYRRRFAASRPPDAVLSVNDFRLVELLRALAPLGLQAGREFEAIGCYDTPWAEAWALTSLSLGVERILAHLDGVLAGRQSVDVLVQPSLVHRASSPA